MVGRGGGPRVGSPPRSTNEGSDPPGRWVGLAVLGSAMLLSLTTWFSATAVLGQLEFAWSMSAAESAWMTIGVQVGFVLGAIVSAVLGLADRIGPRRLLLLGSVGAAICNLILLWVAQPATGIGLRIATGVFLAAVYPPAMKAISTWFRYRRGTALGVMVGALTVGSAAPHLINGLGGLDWRLVIALTSALTLIGGLLAEFVAKDGPFTLPPAPFVRRGLATALKSPGVVLASVGYFGHMWELYAMWAWFGVFFLDILTTNGDPGAARDAALATFLVISIGALGCVLGGLLGDRWGRTRFTSLAMGLSASCAIAIGFLGDAPPWISLLVGLFWGFWVVADSAQFSAIATEVADPRYVGTVLTLQLALGFALTVVTVWLVPLLAAAGGWALAFSALAVGPAVGVVAMLVLRSRPEAARIAGGRG